MQTGSSSSLSLSKKTKKRSSPPTPSPSPSPSTTNMVRPRRKGADRIDDPKKCKATFSKRICGLAKKASALNSLTGARFAFLTLSPKDELQSFSSPSDVEELLFRYLHQRCDSCMTKEDCKSLTMRCRAILDSLSKKSKALENNPVVNAGAGHGSRVRVGAGNDFKIFEHDKINSHEKNYETYHPSLLASRQDFLNRLFKFEDLENNLLVKDGAGDDSNATCPNVEDLGWILDCLKEGLSCDPILQTSLSEESSPSDENCSLTLPANSTSKGPIREDSDGFIIFNLENDIRTSP